jgi:hypothetical protein
MNTLKVEEPTKVLNPEAENLVFSPYTLRMMIGFIAFALPPIVVIFTARITTSISASYHTSARDVFVGALFVIGAFLLAYNGHSPEIEEDRLSSFWSWIGNYWKGAIEFRVSERKMEERLVSLIGGVAAIATALFPTACDTCDMNTRSYIHVVGAVILFLTTAYFCLVAFHRQVKNATKEEVMKIRRRRVYLVCGWGILAVNLILVVSQFTLSLETRNALVLTFVVETISLWLFGISWLTASKFFHFLVDKEEQHTLSLPGLKVGKASSRKERPVNVPS